MPIGGANSLTQTLATDYLLLGFMLLAGGADCMFDTEKLRAGAQNQ
jgi:hypothetical protein